MPALWARLLPHTPETPYQQEFLPYLSQPTLWSSHLAPEEQLSSSENLLGMKAERGGPFLKPQPADRTREALSGMHPEIISAHTESIGSVDRKAKTTCILVLFELFSHHSVMCSPWKGLLF